MSLHFRSVFAVAVFSAVLCLASVAAAQPSQWESVDAIAEDSGSGSLLLVSGVLPESTKLPAQVELSVPAGVELIWAGEVLGGPAQDDPAVQTSKTTKDGMDVYSFTLSEGRRGQVEVAVPPTAAFDGSSYAASLKWSSSQPVPTARLSVHIPAGSSVVQPAEGAALEPAGDGSSYYTRTFEDVGAGDPLAMAFSYTVAPSAPAAASAPQSLASTAVPLVLGVGALAAAIALFVGVSRKMSAKSAAQVDTDDAGAWRGESLDDDGGPDDVGPVPAEEGDAEAEKPRPRRLSPVGAMLVAVGVLVATAVVTISLASGPQVADGKLTKSFGGEASACTSTMIAISPSEGVDLADSGEKILDSFSGIQGIGTVTLYVEDPRVEVQFCDSTTSEQAIREALSTTGLVAF